MRIKHLLFAFSLSILSFSAQAQDNIEAKPTHYGAVSFVEYVSPLTSRPSDLLPPDNSVREAKDKRSIANQIVRGQEPLKTKDDYFVRNRHELEQNISRAPASLVIDTYSSNSQPTDPSLAIGPNHVFVVYNTGFMIYDKSGNQLLGETSPNPAIFPNGGCCDLTVSYDNAADRWVVSFLSTTAGAQIAVSDGANPLTSGWYVYTISAVQDYQKLSVWSDGYYMTENTSGSNKVWVLERSAMLAGSASAQVLGFNLPGIRTSGFFSPQVLNVTDNNLPAAGGATVVYMQDDAWTGVSNDHIKVWTIDVDWANTGNSSISAAQEISVTDFTSVFDNGSFSNLSQPNGGTAIDALQATIMNQAQFRKFTTHNSAVFNFVVDADGSNGELAAVRWIEFRQSGDNQPWSLYQEGTYTAPDGRHAWNASLAMDGNGNIGMGYTSMSGPTTSSTVRVSSYFTGRLSTDPLGTMTSAEGLISNGNANIPGTRYGDYSKIDVDPSDDSSFWFINEYMNNGRRGVVGKFAIQTGPPDTEAPTDPTNLVASNITSGGTTLNWTASTDNVGVSIYNISIDGSPVGTTTGTSFAVTGLSPLTLYTASVNAQDAAGNTSGSITTSFSTLEAGSVTYCVSASTNINDEYIGRVQLNTIDNTSGGQFYTDFTSIATTLTEGDSYTVSVTPIWTGPTYLEGYAVWIDYNNNGDFTDVGELVWSKAPSIDRPSSGTFTVPSGTNAGPTRMRVSMKYNGIPTSCETFTYGEVEDYTIILVDAQAPSIPMNLAASNVTETTVDLSWDASTDNVGVIGYDVYQGAVNLGTVSGTTDQITGLTASTSYTFSVRARDAAGNISDASNTVTVTTLAPPDTQAPSIPTSLAASNVTETTVDLSWDASTDNVGVTGYDVYKGAINLGTVTGTSDQITGLTASTSYTFSVRARDAAGNVSDASNTVTVTTLAPPDTQAPSIPVNLVATNIMETTVILSWDASTDNVGVTGYDVYRGAVNLGTVSGTTDQITGLTASTSYTFSVRARDAAGNVSGASNTVTVTTLAPPDTQAPSIPTSLAASNVTQTTVDLSWDASTDLVGVTGYDVYQGAVNLGTVSGTTDQITGLTASTSYTFSVRARDAAGNVSGASNTVTVTTLAPPDTQAPSDPTSLVASNVTQTTVDLSWDASTDNVGVTGYDVYQDAVNLGTVSGTTDQITGLTASTSYTFSVRARDAAGNVSGASNTVTVTTLAPPDTQAPSIPTSLAASNVTQTTVDLSWDASTDNVGVTGYDVYQDAVNLGTVSGTTDQITGLTASTSYTFSVRARDAAGNVSGASNTVTVTTLAPPDTQAPSDPTSLVASNVTQTTVDLSWDASTDNVGVTGYDVYQDAVNLGTVSGTTDQITGLTASTSYTFSVRARDAAGNVSGASNTVTVTTLAPPDTQAPSDPTSLVASNVTQTTVDLSWDASTDNVGVTGYDVYQDAVNLGTVSGTTDQITGLTASTSYTFSVRARDAAGNVSGASNTVTVTTLAPPDTQAPSDPTSLAASNVTQTTVDLSWDASTDNVGVTGYDVYQDAVNLGTVSGTTDQITGLTASTSYTFSVRARDAAGNVSGASNTVTVTTLAPPDTQAPSIPTSLVASNVTQTTVDLSWDASTDNVGVTGYDVYQDAVNLGTVSGTTDQITGLTASTSYTFSVRARDAAGNVSGASNTITVSTSSSGGELGVIAGYYFETGLEGWIDGGDDCLRILDSARAFEGDYSIRLRDDTSTSNVASPIINLTGNNQVTIEFHAYIESMENREDFFVEFYDGSSYQTIGQYASGTDLVNDTFFTDIIVLDASAFNFNSNNRFRFRNDASGDWDFIFIDQVIISGDNIFSIIPTTPTDLIASNISDTSVVLSWSASTDNDDIAGYEVFENGMSLGTFEETSTTVTGLTPSTTYLFNVRAFDAAGNNSVLSDSVNVTTSGNLGVIAGYYFETGLEGWIDGGDDCLRILDSARAFEGDYSIRLRDDTSTSNVASPIINLTGNNQVTIEFHAYIESMENLEDFFVEFYDGSSYQIIGQYASGTDLVNDTFFTDIIVLDASAYNFNSNNRFRFRNDASGDWDFIFIDQVIISGDNIFSIIPTTPTDLIASNISDTSVVLSWSASTDNDDIAGYEVFESGMSLGTFAETSTTVTGLTPNTTYLFNVRAFDAAGNNSALSDSVNVTTSGNLGVIAGYYFETGLEGWIDGGDDCLRILDSARAFEGDYSIRLRDDTSTSNVASPIINLTGNNQVTIEFHAYIESMENREDFFVEFYDGSSYQIIGQYASGTDLVNDTFFTDIIVLDASAYNFNSNNRFRFRNDASGDWDFIFIDQVIISGDSGLSIATASVKENEQLPGSIAKSSIDTFRLYPNPVKESILNLEVLGTTATDYLIYNMIGQVIRRGAFKNRIDVNLLEAGIYVIQVNTESGKFVERFVKE